MIQDIIVYIIIVLALGGACRYGMRKIKALKKSKAEPACISCPLKNNCTKFSGERKKAANSCCCPSDPDTKA